MNDRMIAIIWSFFFDAVKQKDKRACLSFKY